MIGLVQESQYSEDLRQGHLTNAAKTHLAPGLVEFLL